VLRTSLVQGGTTEAKQTTFSSQKLLTATPLNTSVLQPADIDQDGDLDLLSGVLVDGQLLWYENRGFSEPAFTVRALPTAFEDIEALATADLDGDGDLDLLVGALPDDAVYWFENQGGVPIQFTEHLLASDINVPRAVKTADLDSDGDLDVLTASNMDDTVAWYENNDTVFTKHTITDTLDGAYAVYPADLDKNGYVDLVAAAYNANTIVWFAHEGSDNPAFTQHVITNTAVGAAAVFVADVNNDGNLDILSASVGDNTVAWYESDGAAIPTFTSHIVSDAAVAPWTVSAADVDKDGDMDVFFASQNDDKVARYENDGANPPNFTTHILSELADGARSLFAADLNGDGHQDLLFASFEDGKIGWHQNIPPRYELFLPVVSAMN
jgi:hypothetical protein